MLISDHVFVLWYMRANFGTFSVVCVRIWLLIYSETDFVECCTEQSYTYLFLFRCFLSESGEYMYPMSGSGAIKFYLFCRSVFRFSFLIYFKRGGAVWRVVIT